jgi:hypothetical protein
MIGLTTSEERSSGMVVGSMIVDRITNTILDHADAA